MSTYQTILEWSETKGRPIWLRDALRRMVAGGPLTETDVDDLLAITLQAREIAPTRGPLPPPVPLAAAHIPAAGVPTAGVVFTAARDLKHVNALVGGQALKVAPAGLTTIYGDNGSGKSGYARLFKRACRARSRGEAIRGNVFTGGGGPAQAVFDLEVGGIPKSVAWTDGVIADDLGHVSVFDSACAVQFVDKEAPLDVRPAGLDLFDALARTAASLQDRIRALQTALQAGRQRLPDIAADTAGGRFIATLSAKSALGEAQRLGTLTETEQSRLTDLAGLVAQLRTEDPTKNVRPMRLAAQRLDALAKRLGLLDAALTREREEALKEARQDLATKREVERLATAEAFSAAPLRGVGEEAWRQLWEAARQYSLVHAYPETVFPNTGNEALCVLCQQPIAEAAAARMESFEKYVQGVTAGAATQAQAAIDGHIRTLDELVIRDEASSATIEELRVDAPELADSVDRYFTEASARRMALLVGLRQGTWETSAAPLSPEVALKEQATTLISRAIELEKSARPEERTKVEKELAELRARQELGKALPAISAEITRLQELSKHDLALRDLDTTAISKKGAELSNQVITSTLATRLNDELKAFGVAKLRVQIVPTKGAKGKAYHRLELIDANGTSPGQVLSEGEHRAVALACFFAELDLLPSKSGIILDDPVSSLDHARRARVAARIAAEAKRRQVVVFTHDLAFLLLLHDAAEAAGVPHCERHIRAGAHGPGECEDGSPWSARPAKSRVAALRDEVQRILGPLSRTDLKAYEKEAVRVYGLLRETWERGVEEVLLNKSVMRFGRGVSTLSLKAVLDYCEQDYFDLEAGMAKCSRTFAGHDSAAELNEPVPDHAELTADVAALDEWLKRIVKRRQK